VQEIKNDKNFIKKRKIYLFKHVKKIIKKFFDYVIRNVMQISSHRHNKEKTLIFL